MPNSFARHAKPATLVIAALAATALTGCGLSFERDWRNAPANCVAGDRLAGKWEGTWESHANNHNGKLRAIITRCDDGRYRAQYHATFAYVIPYAFETKHTATPQAGGTDFTGEEDLGFLAGGNYSYSGRSDGSSIVTCYRADKDHGVYRLRRVGCHDPGCCPPTGGCVTPHPSGSAFATAHAPASFSR